MTADETLGATRERVLTEIRTAESPPTVDELATTLGLHRNSVRLHAAALQEAGLITQGSRGTGGRGRPQVVYAPTRSGARAGGRNYELLAEVLFDHLRDTEADPAAAARCAGRAWGGRLAEELGESEVAGVGSDAENEAAVGGEVPTVLADLGFEPVGDEATIELRNCPFRELVDSHQGLVCALHAGMLEGLVARARPGDDGADESVTLEPFTSPTSCTVRLG